jgi:hypothetical protein
MGNKNNPARRPPKGFFLTLASGIFLFSVSSIPIRKAMDIACTLA